MVNFGNVFFRVKKKNVCYIVIKNHKFSFLIGMEVHLYIAYMYMYIMEKVGNKLHKGHYFHLKDPDNFHIASIASITLFVIVSNL